jgi:hypothetical protein
MNFIAFKEFSIPVPYSDLIFIENTVVYRNTGIIIIDIVNAFLFDSKRIGKCLCRINHSFKTLIQSVSKSISNSQCQFFCTKNEILKGMQ